MSEIPGGESVSPFDDAPPSLEQLMRGYQEADRIAAESLMQALMPVLSRFFLSMSDVRRAADDLVQETLLRIHRARHTYRPDEPVLPWAYSIARHVRVDYYRKQRRTVHHEEAVDPDILQVKAVSQRAETESARDFETLMGYLPESQREVLTMLKVLGMTVEEVARVTSSTAGAVKQKAHRAYDRLRSVLERPPAGPTAVGDKS